MTSPYDIEEWDPTHARAAAALLAAAMPEEELSADELLAVLWEDPAPEGDGEGVVLATADGTGMVAVVWRRGPGDDPASGGEAHVKLIAVHPDARRQGRGTALLAAAEEWAWARGATELQVAGSPPFYLWPGVDASATEMLCLLEARGYEPIGVGVNMAMPTSFRADPPEGVVVRRAIGDADVAGVLGFVDAHWPTWRAEVERAIEHGCCHGAYDDTGAPVGFACHSVSRAGWLGPMGTDPARRATGVGAALLGQVCRDLMIAEMATTEICWAGPVRFYAKSGAAISRTFRQFRRPRP